MPSDDEYVPSSNVDWVLIAKNIGDKYGIPGRKSIEIVNHILNEVKSQNHIIVDKGMYAAMKKRIIQQDNERQPRR